MEDSANKKWEEFRKNYCANRPCEPFCSDNEAEMWFAIACYAEENLKRAFLAGLKAGRQWHKVTESLPEMDVPVYLWHHDHKFPAIACRHKECGKIDWYWDCNLGDYHVSRLASIDQGYFWKEIVLPKEEEQNGI